MAADFEMKHLPVVEIKAGQAEEGFVYSNLDQGVKYFEVMLLHPPWQTKLFDFVIEIPGLKTDYQQVDFEALDAAGVTGLDIVSLGRELEVLPCCVLGPDGKKPPAIRLTLL
ncbi:MAG: hypothetical protein M3H12_14165 [Chromatiales bacterium]|nr:hypothetical protein [Gammaproteobacteria bacterium]